MDQFATNEFYTVVVGGSLLACVAGYINAAALQGVFSTPVSHVTGSITKLSVSLLKMETSVVLFSVLVSFMFGAFTSGLLIGNSRFTLGKRYGIAILIEAGALFLACISLNHEMILGEAFAAFACGLQNAMASSYSGAVLRTTHMTGIVTDIGIILGTTASGYLQLLKAKSTRFVNNAFLQLSSESNAKDTQKVAEATVAMGDLWKLKVFVPLLFSYFLGGLLGFWGHEVLQMNSLLPPAFFLVIIGVFYLCWRPSLDMRLMLASSLKKLQSDLQNTMLNDKLMHAPEQINAMLRNLSVAISSLAPKE